MSPTPHPDADSVAVRCAILTVSDTRTPDTDRSGQIIQQQLQAAGHIIHAYQLVKDEPTLILAQLQRLEADEAEVCILNGGTGIAPRDTTYDVLAGYLDKTLPGFGEIFRWLSYQEIGSRAIASRAIAGVHQRLLIFSLPGSSNAVTLAMERLILPELRHLVRQLRAPA